MSRTRVNMERIQALCDGTEDPVNNAEKSFVIAYERSILGDSLYNVYKRFPMEYETLTEHEKDYFTLGYALGQLVFLDNEMKEFINNDDKIH